MLRRLGSAFTALLVLVVGVVTLGGLLITRDGSGPLDGLLTAFRVGEVSALFLQITAITLALLVLAGVVNLLNVHFRRLRHRANGWPYSLVLLIATVGVLVLAGLERAGVVTGEPRVTSVLLESVQVSLESAVAGLVLFALVYGAFRLLSRRVSWERALFILVLLVLLIGALPIPGLPFFGALREWLLAVPVSAGARGILLGIALAAVVVGTRVLLGQDRSYKE